jgi:A/G-specific adenine glycosylase
VTPLHFDNRRVARATRDALLRWYDRARRDLPWRSTRDPYAIWVSETMLQQTRVETVIPYYRRFLERFPDVQALASADADAVYGLWAGLGYYSRARNLHTAARSIVEEFGGRLPDEPRALQSLPGIGRYTAGAIASIAFDRPEPVVDGNVARVLVRLLGIREEVKRGPVQRRLWAEASVLVDGPRPGDLNQALMELGATVCTPRGARCSECPLRRRCDARGAGDVEQLPVRGRKGTPLILEASAGWLVRNGRVLTVRRPPGELMGGLWELPGGEHQNGEKPAEALRRALRERIGLEVNKLNGVGVVEHRFTHRALRLHVFHGDEPTGRVRRSGYEAHRWITPGGLATLPQGAATRKALALVSKS